MNKFVVGGTLPLILLASVAHAQIGWTLNQCRKHWGHENSIEPGSTYTFGSKIQKSVTLDSGGKVNDVSYFEYEDDGPLPIPALLAREEGVTWEKDPPETHARHEFWIGKKDGVIVFHARYYYGHNNEMKWGQYLQVLPIASPL